MFLPLFLVCSESFVEYSGGVLPFCGRCRQNVRHAASAGVSFQWTTPYLLLFLLCQYAAVGFVAITIRLRLDGVEERSISNCGEKGCSEICKKHTDTDTILQTSDISVNKKFDLRSSDTVPECLFSTGEREIGKQ